MFGRAIEIAWSHGSIKSSVGLGWTRIIRLAGVYGSKPGIGDATVNWRRSEITWR